MKKFIGIVLGFVVIVLMLFASLMSLKTAVIIEEQVDVNELIAVSESLDLSNPKEVKKAQTTEINDLPLVDNMDLYQYDDPSSVVEMYITVRKGNRSDNTDHTWAEVNDSTKFFFTTMGNVEVDRAEIIFQVGDENGPLPGEVGFGEISPNAIIQIRGNSASMRSQKSYKIVLQDRTGGWRGQYTIPINKHVGDVTRIKNKLCFDLLKDVPHLLTYRTQFVRLYVKDETSDPPADAFVDYGLFTQIEQPNGRFLRNHQLDPNGHLYKATFFEFYRYADEIRSVNDPLYDLKEFEKRLEVKGNEDHSKLIQMLEDINNPAIPIEQAFEKYFNLDNYFSWMAFNILVGSTDTQAQNFYLYSPQNSERWFFLSWDYDGALNRQVTEEFPRYDAFQYWEEGIHAYWGSVLHKRVLTAEKYRDMLNEKIEEIIVILSPENIEGKLMTYRSVTEPFLNRMPDQQYYRLEEYEFSYNIIPSEVEYNYRLYINSLDEPMPFFLHPPEIVEGKLQFSWDESYDFDGEDLDYLMQVSVDYDFNEIVAEATTINIPRVILDGTLPEGSYFWRVIATNESGFIQYPFDRYIDAEREPHNGMRLFTIMPNGEVDAR